MTTRTLAGRALTVAGEALRIVAFLCAALVILVSVAPDSTGIRLAGPPAAVFVITLALLGVAYLAAMIRDFGKRLGAPAQR